MDMLFDGVENGKSGNWDVNHVGFEKKSSSIQVLTVI